MKIKAYAIKKKDGKAEPFSILFSFHVGNETMHFDKANDIDVDIDINLYFFQTDNIIELLHETGFRIIDTIE